MVWIFLLELYENLAVQVRINLVFLDYNPNYNAIIITKSIEINLPVEQ